jgi:hypothetical protein
MVWRVLRWAVWLLVLAPAVALALLPMLVIAFSGLLDEWLERREVASYGAPYIPRNLRM